MVTTQKNNLRLKGVYLLQIELSEEDLEVGSLGSISFEGHYIYVGSALGGGGLARVKRHLEVNRGIKSGGHWHVDSLLEKGELKRIWVLPTENDLECKLARALRRRLGDGVEGFGSSDCDCPSHLFPFEEEEDGKLLSAMRKVRGEGDGAPFSFDPDWFF